MFMTPFIFDTHAHYDDEQFENDLPQVLEEAARAGVGRIVNIGSTIESLNRCLTLAREYPQIYCALGIHPTECAPVTEEVFADLKRKLSSPKAVAVGEIGLDYYWDTPERELQRYWFRRQLALAEEVSLPVVIHSREAAEETFRILEKEYHGTGVVHCYSYSAEMAKEYVKRGWYIGVGGVVTYKNARKLVETVETIPMERIVLETDCPYLSPVPYRGKRNSSANLPLVVKKIAEIREIPEEEVIRITEKNAERLYGFTKARQQG